MLDLDLIERRIHNNPYAFPASEDLLALIAELRASREVISGLLDCHVYLGAKAGSANAAKGCSRYQAGRELLNAISTGGK